MHAVPAYAHPRFPRVPKHRPRHAYSGALYQLSSSKRLHTGAYVAINGPYDKYGAVLQSEQKEDGSWLNLIRGIRERPSERVVAHF